MLTPHSTVVRTGDIVSAPLGNEIAVLSMESGSYYFLDDVATAIWASLQSPTTPARICERLQERYDVTPSRCETDVCSFLLALHGKGLLRIVD